MKKPTFKRVILVTITVFLAVRIFLNYSGWGGFAVGWLSDQQMIDAAIRYELDHLKKVSRQIETNNFPSDFPTREWKSGDPNPLVTYSSIEHFHSINENCCELERHIELLNDQIHSFPMYKKMEFYINDFIFHGLFGFSENRATISYMKYSIGNKKFSKSIIGVGVRGGAGERHGSRYGYTSIQGF